MFIFSLACGEMMRGVAVVIGASSAYVDAHQTNTGRQASPQRMLPVNYPVLTRLSKPSKEETGVASHFLTVCVE
jgi:hypothetical protein